MRVLRASVTIAGRVVVVVLFVALAVWVVWTWTWAPLVWLGVGLLVAAGLGARAVLTRR